MAYHTNEVEQHHASRRVVAAVVELWDLIVLKRLVALQEVLQPIGLQRTDRFGEIAERFRIGQIERRGGVVSYNPGEDRILREVIVGSTGERVQRHEVIKVAHLALKPLLCKT